jgi:hypothetical protein
MRTSLIQSDGIDLVKLLIQAYHRIKRGPSGRTFLYCSADIAASLDWRSSQSGNVRLGLREYAGAEVLHFRDWPIRTTDALVSTEPLVAVS